MTMANPASTNFFDNTSGQHAAEPRMSIKNNDSSIFDMLEQHPQPSSVYHPPKEVQKPTKLDLGDK